MVAQQSLFVYPGIQSGGSIKMVLKDGKQIFLVLNTGHLILAISVEYITISSLVLFVWFAIDLLLKCFQVILNTKTWDILQEIGHMVFVIYSNLF